MSISVSIVEDAAGVREGLVRLLQSASGFACLASYPDAETALAEIPRQPPDVVLMDIDLPGMNGVECVRRLKALLPALRVVMLTVYDNPEKIFDALSAGAIGYLLKKRLTEDLLDSVGALRKVNGEARLTLAGLLLFGKAPALRRLAPARERQS